VEGVGEEETDQNSGHAAVPTYTPVAMRRRPRRWCQRPSARDAAMARRAATSPCSGYRWSRRPGDARWTAAKRPIIA